MTATMRNGSQTHHIIKISCFCLKSILFSAMFSVVRRMFEHLFLKFIVSWSKCIILFFMKIWFLKFFSAVVWPKNERLEVRGIICVSLALRSWNSTFGLPLIRNNQPINACMRPFTALVSGCSKVIIPWNLGLKVRQLLSIDEPIRTRTPDLGAKRYRWPPLPKSCQTWEQYMRRGQCQGRFTVGVESLQFDGTSGWLPLKWTLSKTSTCHRPTASSLFVNAGNIVQCAQPLSVSSLDQNKRGSKICVAGKSDNVKIQ